MTISDTGKLPRSSRPSTATIRSRVVLEIAAELVARGDQPYQQTKVMLRPPRGPGGCPCSARARRKGSGRSCKARRSSP